MNDEALSEILRNGGSIPIPYFDSAAIEIMVDGIEDSPNPEGVVTPAEALAALKNFLQLTPDHRKSDARHLVAYCRMMMDAVGDEDILDDMGGDAPSDETIWNHAKPSSIFFSDLNPGKYASARTVYVQIEGEVAWEPEHGLQMSWENGERLVKCGEFDGHPTNGHATAEPENDAYVFYSYTPEFCTRREGD